MRCLLRFLGILAVILLGCGQASQPRPPAPVEVEDVGVALNKPAPETSGQDLEGVPLALSSQRGKVVMLSFWASWCGPCIQLIPHEKKLVQKYEGRPFVLLGVNCDENRASAQRVVAQKLITWPSWWDGKAPNTIQKQWQIAFYPSVYLIDAKGTLRFGPRLGEDLDNKIEKLVREAEAEAKN